MAIDEAARLFSRVSLLFMTRNTPILAMIRILRTTVTVTATLVPAERSELCFLSVGVETPDESDVAAVKEGLVKVEGNNEELALVEVGVDKEVLALAQYSHLSVS